VKAVTVVHRDQHAREQGGLECDQKQFAEFVTVFSTLNPFQGSGPDFV
jgi:hypothetical protein